jgi:outer membrane protein assembly factor BamB
MLILTVLNLVIAHANESTPRWRRAIVAVARDTGRVEWTCEGLDGPTELMHKHNSPATPTPLIFNDRVVAHFGNAGVLCSDHNGRLLWTNTDTPYRGIHGPGTSPVRAGNAIIIANARADAPSLIALDPSSGVRKWTHRATPWPGTHGEHRTPLIIETSEGELVVQWWQQNAEVTAHDPETGNIVWTVPIDREKVGEAVATAIVDGPTLYLASQSRVLALREERGEGSRRHQLIWKTLLAARGPNTSSPVLARGLLFMVSDRGFATCLDAEDGKVLWQQQLSTAGGASYYASPVAAGECIYFASTKGLITVVGCSRDFRRIAENQLPDGIYATPAPAVGRLYIRTLAALWCIQQCADPDTSSSDPVIPAVP